MKQLAQRNARDDVMLLSVLSVEPYGMKYRLGRHTLVVRDPFSALGRAVWDETGRPVTCRASANGLSVLSVEPYGMKPTRRGFGLETIPAFSALGRAVWDETG